MKIRYTTLLLLFMAAGLFPAMATNDTRTVEDDKNKRAWEIGLGGSVFQFNRVAFSNFQEIKSGGYLFDLDLKHAVYGGNIYAARELTNHFYIDLQGSAGFTKDELGGENKRRWYYTAGVGLQFRLGEFFNSKYIDPYLRAGVGYMHKNFDILYTGKEGLSPDEMSWVMENFHNKDGKDRKHLMPVSLGLGVNMWLNDRWGIGTQGDYVLMPYSNVANSLQGTVRVMYRIGGKSKKPAPRINYVDRPYEVEKIVERVVEKRVEVPGKEKVLLGLFNNIHFDFDKATITEESGKVLDQIAEILRVNSGERFLITGFTDARGSQRYNQDLSERRAKAVVDALVDRGVSKDIMKARGIGSRATIAKMSASDIVRRGDRKVTIEIISNQDYWNYMEEAGY